MVRRKKTRKRPARKVALKRVRRNPARKTTRKKSTARKTLAKRARRASSVSKHRPTLYKTRKGWRRPKRSRLNIKGVPRMNPAMKLLSQKNLTRISGLAAGTALGFLVLPVVYQVLPAQVKNRKFVGFGNVALGALLFGYMKNRVVKDAGVMIAATGIYDLITQMAPQLGLPMVGETNFLTAQLRLGQGSTPASAPAQATGLSYEVNGQKVLGLSYDGRAQVPATVGLSYETAGMGSSWERDSDNPFAIAFD